MSVRLEWQLYVRGGHGSFKGTDVCHIFAKKEEALAFLADHVVAPAIKACEVPPEAHLKAVVRHNHAEEVIMTKKARRS